MGWKMGRLSGRSLMGRLIGRLKGRLMGRLMGTVIGRLMGWYAGRQQVVRARGRLIGGDTDIANRSRASVEPG